MAGNRIHQEQVLSGVTSLLGNRIGVVNTSNVTRGQILAITGQASAGGFLRVVPFDPAVHGKEVRLIASRTQAADSRAHDLGLTDFVVLSGVDTSGAPAQGSPVWADPAVPGGWTTTNPGASGILVGMVAVKHASSGAVFLTTRPDPTPFILILLAATTASKGASMIGVEDSHTVFTGTDLETVLYELYLAATTAGSDTFTDTTGRYAVDQVGSAFAEIAVDLTLMDAGSPASWLALFPNQPADGNTMTVGADVYEFVDPAINTVVNDDAHIAVVIGAAAADTRTNWIDAINGVGTADATITLADGLTPALADGTLDLLADPLGPFIRFRTANAPGGNVVPGDPSIVLAENVTDPGDIWGCGNVNVNTLQGSTNGTRPRGIAEVTVTAAMITNTFRFDFVFTVTDFHLEVYSAAGIPRYQNGVVTDAYTIDNGGILATFGGGVAPNVQANDIIRVIAWGAPA